MNNLSTKSFNIKLTSVIKQQLVVNIKYNLGTIYLSGILKNIDKNIAKLWNNSTEILRLKDFKHLSSRFTSMFTCLERVISWSICYTIQHPKIANLVFYHLLF